MSDEWNSSSGLWRYLGSPLRPAPQDMAVVSTRMLQADLQVPGMHALVLGTTAEYLDMPWTADVVRRAVDHSPSMLKARWPHETEWLCANWLSLPHLFPDPAGSVDLMLCDGGLNLLPFPAGQAQFPTALASVLKPAGVLIIRLFVLPHESETPEAVLGQLVSGGINNLNELKLRLWMAIQPTPGHGVNNILFWQTVMAAVPDYEQLARLLCTEAAYLQQTVATADDRTYYFADLDTLRGYFCDQPGGFQLEECRVPDYPLGERCPTLVFRRVVQG